MKDKLIQAVKDALGSSDSFEQYDSVSKEQYVILINGKRVRMRSGKTVWNGKGPAKSALRNHITHVLWRNKVDCNNYMITDQDGGKDYGAVRDIIKVAEDEWIDKYVVFMPLAEYIDFQRKRSA
ncbi:hypothetical protein LCGC14_2154770 [marine sediment metagenome]|uniref:Uncharacterized protein n=1 Tax=marine sediment metagenome TaxID=412755 RepID=A0A0F9G7J3_9ZZZZ